MWVHHETKTPIHEGWLTLYRLLASSRRRPRSIFQWRLLPKLVRIAARFEILLTMMLDNNAVIRTGHMPFDKSLSQLAHWHVESICLHEGWEKNSFVFIHHMYIEAPSHWWGHCRNRPHSRIITLGMKQNYIHVLLQEGAWKLSPRSCDRFLYRLALPLRLAHSIRA